MLGRKQVYLLAPLFAGQQSDCVAMMCRERKVAVSGAGNVAIYTAEKLLEFGATVLTMSDSSGYVYFEKGITREQLTAVDTHKVANRGRLSDFKEGESCSRACAAPHAEACMVWIATR